MDTTFLMKSKETQSQQWQSLMRLMEGRSQSLVFYGLNSGLLSPIVKDFIQMILCENHNSCGVCRECQTLAKDQSLNLYHARPQNNLIKVEESQYIHKFFALQAIRHRIVWIEDAHLLGSATANSLLKIIEEPPLHSHFVLSTPALKSLLPTIRSRCLPVLSVGESGLKVGPASANSLQFIKDVSAGGSLKTWRDQFKTRDSLRSFCESTILDLRNIVLQNELSNSDSLRQIVKLYELLTELRSQTTRNADIQLCWDRLEIQLARSNEFLD